MRVNQNELKNKRIYSRASTCLYTSGNNFPVFDAESWLDFQVNGPNICQRKNCTLKYCLHMKYCCGFVYFYSVHLLLIIWISTQCNKVLWIKRPWVLERQSYKGRMNFLSRIFLPYCSKHKKKFTRWSENIFVSKLILPHVL